MKLKRKLRGQDNDKCKKIYLEKRQTKKGMDNMKGLD